MKSRVKTFHPALGLLLALLAGLFFFADKGRLPGHFVGGELRMPTVGDNSFIQAPVPWIDVTGYGAKGDGTTDDTKAIQNAIAAVPPEGGTVFFPVSGVVGTVYKITSTLLIQNRRGINLIAEKGLGGMNPPNGATLKWFGRKGGNMLNLNGINRSSFRGLWFDGNSKLAGICIHVQNDSAATVASGNLDFFDIGIRNCTTGVQIGVPGANQSNNSELNWWNLELVGNTDGYLLTSDQAGHQWFYGLLAGNNTNMLRTGDGGTLDRGNFVVFSGSAGGNMVDFNLPSLSNPSFIMNFDSEEVLQFFIKSDPATSSAGGPLYVINSHAQSSVLGAQCIKFRQVTDLNVIDSKFDQTDNSTFIISVGNRDRNPAVIPTRTFMNVRMTVAPTLLDTANAYRVVVQNIPKTGAWGSTYSGAYELLSGTGTLMKITMDGAISSAVNSVKFSSNPVFDASLGNTQKIILTGSVTRSSLFNATKGETISFVICQDATGGRSFVFPSNVLGAGIIGSIPNKCNVQSFIYDGRNAYATGRMQINL